MRGDGADAAGTIATQLARQLTRLKIISTASRPETVQWCQRMGAHHVVDHRQPLAKQVKGIMPDGVNYVLALTKTEDHFDEVIEAMVPQRGRVAERHWTLARHDVSGERASLDSS